MNRLHDVFGRDRSEVIQALTEFLPVSSSGHLVLGQAVFGIEPSSGIAFEIMVHLGTLFSVVFVIVRI